MVKKQKKDTWKILQIIAFVIGWLNMFIGWVGGVWLEEYSIGAFGILVGLVIVLGVNGSLKLNQNK